MPATTDCRTCPASDLDCLPRDEQVFRFEVSVKEPVLVHVREPRNDLEHDVLDALVGQKLLAVLGHLVHVLLEELEHEEQLVVLADHLA